MNWFQRLRQYIIIKTAESYYDKMARQCVDLHKKTKHHHYIIIDPWYGKKIVITNRANFRATKRAINDSGMRMAVNGMEGLFTTAVMPDVHKGCFYSSMLQTDLEKLKLNPTENTMAIHKMEVDIEARRRAYIKWTLENAKIRRGLFQRISDNFTRRRGAKMVREELQAIKDKKTTAHK